MASYSISWRKSTKKDLRKIQKEHIVRIVKAVESLANSPYPEGSIKLIGSEFTYRIRVGDYRIIYEVLEKIIRIEVIKVAHRSDVYKPKA